MYEPQLNTTGNFNGTQIVRLIAGISLISLGIIIAIWLLFNLYTILHTPEEIALIAKIVPNEPADALIRSEFGDIELPRSLFVGIAYIVTFFLYSLFASIANTLIRNGTELLQSDLKQLVDKLTTELKTRR
jgi:hypothetical protein